MTDPTAFAAAYLELHPAIGAALESIGLDEVVAANELAAGARLDFEPRDSPYLRPEAIHDQGGAR